MTTDARELYLYTTNDGQLYESIGKHIQANLMKKVAKGSYDPSRAPDAWMYLADAGSQKYKREFGGAGGTGSHAFPIGVRREVARAMADDFDSELSVAGAV